MVQEHIKQYSSRRLYFARCPPLQRDATKTIGFSRFTKVAFFPCGFSGRCRRRLQWADSLYSGGIVVLHGIGLIAWHRLAGSEVRHAVAIHGASLWQQATALVQDVWLRLRQGQGSSIASDTTIGGSAPTMN